MRKLIFLFLLSALSVGMSSQMDIQVGAMGGNNFGNTFGEFRDKYNELNKEDLRNNLGGMSLYKGLQFELNYRVLGISCGLTRSYIHSGTSAKFNNGSKRIIDQEYKLTNVFIGGAFNIGEKSEMRIDVGMVHSVSSLYSKVKLPTNEIDYGAGGASHESTFVNIGLSGRVMYIYRMGERFNVFGSLIYNRIKSDELGTDSSFTYSGTTVTHTFSGVLLNVGVGLKLLKKIE